MARKQGKPLGSKRNFDENFILSLVRKPPDIGLDEIAEALKSECGVSVCSLTSGLFSTNTNSALKNRPCNQAGTA